MGVPGDLYHGEYPVDMTPAEARAELANAHPPRDPASAEECMIQAHEYVRQGDHRMGYFKACEAYGKALAKGDASGDTEAMRLLREARKYISDGDLGHSDTADLLARIDALANGGCVMGASRKILIAVFVGYLVIGPLLTLLALHLLGVFP